MAVQRVWARRWHHIGALLVTMSRNGTVAATDTSTTRTAELEEPPGLSLRWPHRRSWCQQACPYVNHRASAQPGLWRAIEADAKLDDQMPNSLLSHTHRNGASAR